MSKIEFKPFPVDSAISEDAAFCEMVGRWYTHLDYDIYGTGLDADLVSEDAKKTTQEVHLELLTRAREEFPDRNPNHIVYIARWLASNIYQEQMNETGERWHI